MYQGISPYGDPYIKDDLGGLHEGGCGWNPYGIFCGECARASCVGCFNADTRGDLTEI